MSELMAALPGVLSAPKTGSAVELLCFRPGYGERRFVDELALTRDRGIPGERWETAPWLKLPDGSGHPGIQVSILPRRVLDLVWRDRAGTVHPGDTFVCDLDMTEANLPEGQLLAVGIHPTRFRHPGFSIPSRPTRLPFPVGRPECVGARMWPCSKAAFPLFRIPDGIPAQPYRFARAYLTQGFFAL